MDSFFNLDINDKLEEEHDDGNVEYKRTLINLDEDTFNRRVTQMLYRLHEGNFETIYIIGISDSGILMSLNEKEYNESIINLKLIAAKLDCSVIKLSESNKNNLFTGEFLIRGNDKPQININIAVCGRVDSGKSSTIGVLISGKCDNGNGESRLRVFNYKHEIQSGRTSSISHQIMGFDNEGNVVNSNKNNSWFDIGNKSAKIISFYDLAGHEKYLKTTIYGLTSHYPDYCLIMIAANMGIDQMTREHIGVCINLNIPFIILVTKIDIAPQNILEETMTKIFNMCKNRIRKIPYLIKNISDIINTVKNISSIVPILQISNVSNYNIDLLKTLLNLLPLRNDYSKFINEPVEFLIDNTYANAGHSTIVSGMLTSGTIKVNDTLLIGPYYDSTYKQAKVRSIHINYKDLKQAYAGSFVCISLKNITRREIKKGMVLINNDNSLKLAIKQFIAQIYILQSPTTIKEGYQPFIHIGHVRQAVKLLEIDNKEKILRTGDKAIVKLEFIIKPEYIKIGSKLVFREGKVKAAGKIIEIIT
jgi:translation elongation factor EF-Tu-like GTPase